jgi:hypothetical protein
MLHLNFCYAVFFSDHIGFYTTKSITMHMSNNRAANLINSDGQIGVWKGGLAWQRGKFSLPLTSLVWNNQTIFRGIKIKGESLISPIYSPHAPICSAKLKYGQNVIQQHKPSWSSLISDAGRVRLTWFCGRWVDVFSHAWPPERTERKVNFPVLLTLL